MARAINQLCLEINHREAGNNPGILGLHQTLFYAWNKFARHRTTNDRAVKLVTSFSQRRKLDFHPGKLAGTTRLLFMGVINFNFLGDGLAVSHLRRANIRFHLEFTLQTINQNIQVKFTHTGSRAQASINTGLLCYPVLMAADILLYNADRVPVGEDQRQHLELCRDLAERFNRTYSETFKVPAPYVPETAARVMSLADPTRKMSKSDENDRATLYILDEPDRIRKKIGSAVTDSGSEVKTGPDKPGVANLLAIHSALSGETVTELEEKFSGQGYGAFKSEVAEVVVEALTPVREKYHELIADKEYLQNVLRDGAEAAQRRANRIISKVYRKIGFPERPRMS